MRKYLMDASQNCFQCCLAGMFDLEKSDVPGVHAWSKEDGDWFNGLYKWSKRELKHAVVAVVDDTLDDLFHIAVLRGEDEDYGHAVIAFGSTVVWDPNPIEGQRATTLDKLDYSLVFIPLAGLSVQRACMLSWINDWRDMANKAMHKSIMEIINNG